MPDNSYEQGYHHQLANERGKLYRLRVHLIKHLRTVGDLVHAQRLVDSYIQEFFPFEHRYDWFITGPDGCELLAAIAPDWHYTQISLIKPYYHVIAESPYDTYICRYVAIHPNNPIVVTALTARIHDITRILEPT